MALAAVLALGAAGLAATGSAAATGSTAGGYPAATGSTVATGSGVTSRTARADGLVLAGGVSQPVHAAADVITERIWVETAIDTDHDGRRDRVAIDIERPAGPERVATILTASPYWECCQDVANHPVDVDRLPQESLSLRSDRSSAAKSSAAGSSAAASSKAGAVDAASSRMSRVLAEQAALATRTANEVSARYVPRGYASVRAQTIGTADSDGCPTSGDHNETLSVTAVIDWLAGRGKGFDEAGKPAKATWSTGKIGMIGVSYNGTLPQQVATTGIKGLETIVPISAISSWYDYYRANGLVVAPGTYQGEDTDILARFVISDRQKAICEPVMQALERDQDRVTGDWSPFWQDRDYVHTANRVRASVFVVHGLNDWNVKTQHVEQFWDVLARNNVPRKIWWHQGEHGGPQGATDYTLPDGRASTFDDTVNRWMDHWLYGVDNGIEKEPRAIIQREDGSYHTYRDWPDNRVRERGYPLSALGGGNRVQSFVDAGASRTAEQLSVAPDAADPNRLAYFTGKLAAEQRISGIAKLKLKLSVNNRKDANVTGLLVDYAPDGTATIVSRGWTDPQNRASVHFSLPVKPRAFYSLSFGMQPKDYVFAAGHRIGLVVISTDFDYTLRPSPGTALSLDPRASSLTLPMVG